MTRGGSTYEAHDGVRTHESEVEVPIRFETFVLLQVQDVNGRHIAPAAKSPHFNFTEPRNANRAREDVQMPALPILLPIHEVLHGGILVDKGGFPCLGFELPVRQPCRGKERVLAI